MSKSERKSMLTFERVRERLNYDPETGIFTWAMDYKGGVRKGEIAGPGISGRRDYKRIFVDRVQYKSHRLAFLWMTGRFPEGEVDHINGDVLDNRWENLREVSHHENGKNQRLKRNNSSGVSGVTLRGNRYEAHIRIGGKRIQLGSHKTIFDAAATRKSAENQHRFHDNHGRMGT